MSRPAVPGGHLGRTGRSLAAPGSRASWQALLPDAPAAYPAHDMDRARLDVWAPDVGLIDTCTAPGTTVRRTCVLYSIES